MSSGPSSRRLYTQYTADGKLNDARDVVIGATNASLFAYVAALALCGANRHAQIGFSRQAIFALAAFGRVERDYVIALFDARHFASDIDDDAGTLMAENCREQTLGVGARQRKRVGVADPGRLDFDQHLADFWTIELNRLDR